MSRPPALLCALALAGCVFDTSGVALPSAEHALADAPRADQTGRAERAVLDGPRADRADAARADGQRPDLRRDAKGDAPGPDRATPDLKKPDSRPPDMRKPDSRPPDMRKPDSRPPDMRKPDVQPPPTCASLFSGVVGYWLCTETPTTCRFYRTGSTISCTQACGAKPCIKAEDNEPGQKCTPETNMSCGGQPCTCSSSIGDGICTCGK